MGPALRSVCLLGLVLVSFAACRRAPREPEVPKPPETSAAAEAVGQFLSVYRGNFREADERYLSHSLAAALQSAAEAEKESAARVKSSEFPNDKPLILEGEIFAGLYEGFTAFKVGAERAGQGETTVEVRFRNEPYNVDWTDDFLLVEEDGWKIDDVRYVQKKAGMLGLREVLQDFENAAAAEAAAAAKAP